MRRIILCIMLLFAEDGLLIFQMRTLLRDMIQEKRSRKAELRIYNEQPLKQKILLSYIKDHIVSYKRYYSWFHFLYHIELIVIIPQYIFLMLAIIITKQVFFPVYIPLFSIKLLLLIIMRVFFFPDGHNSVFKK